MKTFKEEDIQMEEEMMEKQINEAGEPNNKESKKQVVVTSTTINLRPNSQIDAYSVNFN